MATIDHSITNHQGLVGETNLASGSGSAAAIASQLSTKANLISTPTNLDIVQTNGSGQPIDSGKVFSTDITLGGGSSSNNNISTQLAVKTYADTTIASQLSTKANLISTPTNLDIVQTNGSGQPIDSGKVFSTDITLGGGSPSNNNISTQLAVKTYVDGRSTGTILSIGTLNNVTVGLIEKWTQSSSLTSLAPLTSAQATISWDTPFPNNMFIAIPSVREGTANLPLTIKILGSTLSDISVEVTNLDATDAAGVIVINVLAFGN